jgi:hypothetical protein
LGGRLGVALEDFEVDGAEIEFAVEVGSFAAHADIESAIDGDLADVSAEFREEVSVGGGIGTAADIDGAEGGQGAGEGFQFFEVFGLDDEFDFGGVGEVAGAEDAFDVGGDGGEGGAEFEGPGILGIEQFLQGGAAESGGEGGVVDGALEFEGHVLAGGGGTLGFVEVDVELGGAVGEEF